MPNVICRSCGLEVTTRQAEPMVCPRCLATSSGALSIPLEPRPAVSDDKPRCVIARLARRRPRQEVSS
jgi:hypothetical protein